MVAIEVGRICVKTTGREAGRKCVMVDIVDDSFVLITGPKDVNGVKRRRVNVRHIEVTNDKIIVKKDASDDEVKKALEKAGKLESMKETVKI
ncbi:MAG: 50S ribosomal protein L14e [Candidatus Atabeyarchaeum deiterrae]|jgi:large subunit ribosomal protein L14e